MHRSLKISFFLAMTLGVLAGCSDEQPPVNRVGVNVVDKALFTGSWYYNRVVIDVDYEAAGIGTFPGDTAYDFTFGFGFALPRVRWVIDEDTIFAYRDYELIEGINPPEDEATPGNIIGHPVAAWNVDSHFDIRRGYSTTTGEEQNVIVENTTDRRWWERQYMRVDWSQNLLPGYFGQTSNLFEVFGLYSREPAGLFVQGASDFPESWRPQFEFMACESLDDEGPNCDRGARELFEDYDAGELYHMSFVTQELVSPGNVTNPFTGGPVNWCLSPFADAPICTTTAVYVRNSFLKVSDTRQYAPENWDDGRFDRHGYFRNERPVFDRSTDADDPAFGRSDFLNYNVNRQNIWRDWYEVDEVGNPVLGADGRPVAVPFTERRIRENIWTTSPEVPAHLMEPSFDLVAQWNVVLMETVRNLRGEASPEYSRVSCQTDDPDGYCFCTPDPENPGAPPINATCPGVYDPFEAPSEAGGRVSNGAAPYDCYVQTPASLEDFDWNKPDLTDTDFYAWYDATFVGDECVMTLDVNSCNKAAVEANGGTTAGLDCEERGDLRYRFLSYVAQPGTGFLGIATLRGDPVSGEIISGDANIGGPALDGYRTFALQTIDLVNGDVTDREFLVGEDIRSYIDNLNRAVPPAAPREPFMPDPAAVPGGPDAMPAGRGMRHETLLRRMDAYVDRARGLEGPEGRNNIFEDRIRGLAGTDLEQRLTSSPDFLAMAGIDRLDRAPAGFTIDDMGDGLLDRMSPFRVGAFEQLRYQNDIERRLGEANVMMPNEYTDYSVLEFVNRHRDWPRARLEIALNQLLYYQTQLHELGHCLGLRHSFGASTDIPNFDDEYHLINARFPYPNPQDFDTDGDLGLSELEQDNYESEYDRVKELRELAGADRWMTTSIMEYTAQWYERTQTGAYGPGNYDVAAVSYGYGDVVEFYNNGLDRDGSPRTPLPVSQLNVSNTSREWARWYPGGDSCNVDTDCPHSTGGSQAGTLLPGQITAGLTQTCQAHPNGPAFGNICSNFDDDAAALITAPDAAPQYAPVEYRFCTDDRVGTYAWCHRFDEGDSYREIVRNTQEQYERQYVFTNFRRYRTNFSLGGYVFGRLVGRQYNTLQAIFQNLLFLYQQDPEYRDSTGPFGFDDHFLAAADTMDFYARVIGQPGLGSFRWDEGFERYIRSSERPESPSVLTLPFGLARYPFSEYQTTLSGITRIELIGTFFEKVFTMQMLTSRGWTASYTRDVPFWTNFYDLFPVEVEEMFRGFIVNQPEAIAPRVRCGSGTFPNCGDPELVFMDFYRGDCSEGPDEDSCRESAEERFDDLPVVDPGSISTLQFYAMIFALGSFPVFYDTRFENQMYVCIEGRGDCFDFGPSDVEYEPGETTVEESDFVRYEALRFGRTFVARATEPQIGTPEAVAPGFSLVRELKELNYIVEALQRFRGDFDDLSAAYSTDNLRDLDLARLAAVGYEIPASTGEVDTEINRLEARIFQTEGFTFALIDILARFRIAGYAGL